jgi:hypothetical protein
VAFFFAGDFAWAGGASSGSLAAGEVEEGVTALEEMEMEMQLCHGTHLLALRPEHSDDHHGLEDSGWETCEYRNHWEYIVITREEQ